MKTQHNMRIHLLLALLALMVAATIGVSRVELTFLVMTIGMVFVAEMLNTAIEQVVDMITTEYHPLAKIAKDVAAGAVLLAAITAVVVGFLIFYVRLEGPGQALPAVSQGSLAATGIALLLVTGVVALIKGLTGSVSWRGGFPSAHAAVAFSLATSIYWLGASFPIVLLGGVIAALVAQTRVEAGFHTVLQVVAGAVIGALLTVATFHWMAG